MRAKLLLFSLFVAGLCHAQPQMPYTGWTWLWMTNTSAASGRTYLGLAHKVPGAMGTNLLTTVTAAEARTMLGVAGAADVAVIANFASLMTDATTVTTALVSDPVAGGVFTYSATAPGISDAVRYVDGFAVASGTATIDTVIPHGYANGESVTLSGATIALNTLTTSATATSGSTKTITSITFTNVPNKLIINIPAHGFSDGATVTIANVPQPWAFLNADHTIIAESSSTFLIAVTHPLLNTAHTITVTDADSFTIPLAIGDGNVAGSTILATGAWRTIEGLACARVAGGYWTRQYSGPINPVWMGLVETGSATLAQAQTNTYAVNRALALKQATYYQYKTDVLIPPGQYGFSDSIEVNDYAVLRGSGRSITQLYRSSTGSAVNPIIRIRSVGTSATVSDMTIYPLNKNSLIDGVFLTYLRGVGCQRPNVSDMQINSCTNGLHLNAGDYDYATSTAPLGIYFGDFTRVFIYGGVNGIRTSSSTLGSINDNWFNSCTVNSCSGRGVYIEAGVNFFDGLSVEYSAGYPIYDAGNVSSYENYWIEDNYAQGLVFSGNTVFWGAGVLAEGTDITVDTKTAFLSYGFSGSEGGNIVVQYPNDGIQYPRGTMGGDTPITSSGTRYPFAGGRTTLGAGTFGAGITFTTNSANAQSVTYPYIGAATDLDDDWTIIMAHKSTELPSAGNHRLIRFGPTASDAYIGIQEVAGTTPTYSIQVGEPTNIVDLASWDRASSVVTVTTDVDHTFVTGDTVVIVGYPTAGVVKSTAITSLATELCPSTNQFTFADALADSSGTFAAGESAWIRYSALYGGTYALTTEQSSGAAWLMFQYDSTDKVIRYSNGRQSHEFKCDWSEVSKCRYSAQNSGVNGSAGTYTTIIPFYGFWNRLLSMSEVAAVMNEQQHRQGDVLPLVPNLVFDAGYTPTLSGASQVGIYSALDGSSKAQLYTVNSDGYVNQLSGNMGIGTNAPTAQLVVLSQPGEPALVLENDFNSGGSLNVLGGTRGYGAVDLQYGRNLITKIASGTNSVIGGGTNNTATAYCSTVPGGSGNSATGIGASALGGASNTASGLSSATIGEGNTANQSYSMAFGYSGSSSGYVSATIGDSCTASGSRSMATGNQSASVLNGQLSRASGRFAATGDAQMSILTARALLTLAQTSSTNLWLDGASATLNVPNATTWVFRAEIVGRTADSAGNEESGAYTVTGCIEKDDSTAANTRIVGTVTTTTIAEDDAAWDATATADPTNGALTITCTGNNETTIRWVATVYLTQVGG